MDVVEILASKLLTIYRDALAYREGLLPDCTVDPEEQTRRSDLQSAIRELERLDVG